MKSWYDTYTPLTTTRAQILMKIEGENYLHRPLPIKNRGKNKKKYYRFRCNYSHDTKQYFQLKDEIEALIRQKLLAKYRLDHPTQPHNDQPPASEEVQQNRPTAGVINMISN